MTGDDLSQINIKLAGFLWLKTDCGVRVAATRQLGNNGHWSSDGLYRHLEVLKNLVLKVGNCTQNVWGTNLTYYTLNPPE